MNSEKEKLFPFPWDEKYCRERFEKALFENDFNSQHNYNEQKYNDVDLPLRSPCYALTVAAAFATFMVGVIVGHTI